MASNKITRPNSAVSDTEESFWRKRRSFAAGFTLTEPKEVLLWPSSINGDNNYYQWKGSFPKVVAAGSNPSSTGGVSPTAWVNVGNANYFPVIDANIDALDVRVTAIENNPTGKSAYQSYLDTTTDNPPLTEAQWVASLQGVTGPGLVIKGSFGSTDDLPMQNNTPGDAYIIGEQMWVWDSVQWSPVGQVGPEGKSAYQVWILQGNSGTEQDFLNALEGAKGDPGPQGAKGDPGNNATGFIYQGSLNSTTELPPATADNVSWAYSINGELYVSSNQGWVNIGSIVGPQGPQGPTGPMGPQGPTGANGTNGSNGSAGPAGPQGPQGPTGPQGVPGQDGAGLEILDTYQDQSQLPTTGSAGDAYLINDDLYVWLTGATSFTNVGPLTGPQGPQGPTGPAGPTGPQGPAGPQGSAGANGNSLLAKGYLTSTSQLPASGNSEADMYYVNGITYIWDGSQWVNMGSNVGPQGIQGDPGPQGLPGLDGDSAYEVWLDQGNTGSESDFLADLTGPAGPTGPQGPQGPIGAGVSILGSLASTNDLPSTGNLGEGYLIGSDFYVWTGSSYDNVGPIRGPDGPVGPQGPIGPQGATGATGLKGDQGSLWIVLARAPGPSDGRIGDYYIDSTTNRYYQKTSSTNWAYMGTMGGGNVYDAPNDGVYYVRRNQAWVADPVQEAPSDGSQYARTNGAWTAISFPTPPVAEAPSDGQQYVRKDGGWAVFALPSNVVTEAPTGNQNLYARSNGGWVQFAAGIADAASDGNLYARRNGAWQSFVAGIPEAPVNTTTVYGRGNAAWTAVTPEAPTTAGAYYVRSANAWQRFNRYDLNVGATTASLDVSTNQVFTVDLSTARTLTLTNLPSGRAMAIVIIFSGNGGAVSWGNTINWTDGTAPVYSTNRTVVTLLWDGAALIGLKPGGY